MVLPPVPIPDLPAGGRGRDITSYLSGIGGEVRASRAYAVVPGVTESPPIGFVQAPDPPVVFWEGVYPPPYLEWGRVYSYALSLAGPNATESAASAFSTVQTPRLPPAPRVTAVAAGFYTTPLLYGLTAFVRRTNGLYAETPVGPLAYAAPPAGMAAPVSFRISLPDAAGEPPGATSDVRTEGYFLYRAVAPASGQPILWDGRLGWLGSGDAVTDAGLPATPPGPATTGGPRVFVQATAPPYRPDAGYRVYGRDAGRESFLHQQGAGDGSPWVDDGTAVPRAAGPPSFPVRSPGIGEGAYAPGNVHQFSFRSREVVVRAIDGPVVVQLDPGEGRWEQELYVRVVRTLHFAADRIRVRTADASGAQQTRYLVEVFD